MLSATRTRPGLGAALSSVRGNRPFQLLWWSNLFFFGGAWGQTLVLGWIAYDLTRSEFLVAVFTAVKLARTAARPADRRSRRSLPPGQDVDHRQRLGVRRRRRGRGRRVGRANLSNANALNSLAMNVTAVIGPALGGALIAGVGAPAALWISTTW